MMRKGLNSSLKICVLVLFMLSLCFVSSCKKSVDQPAPPSAGGDANAPDAGKVEPAKVEPAKVEPAKVEPAKVEPAKVEPAGDLAPIDLELPKPMFVGTPQDTRVENLEKPLGHPRPPFSAPAGTRNVSKGKPVSSSDEEPIIGEIDMITDGDMEAADGSYVELGPFQQYVTIDLEAAYNMYAVVVWHYHKQARVYFDVVVQVAADPDFITDVQTIFNNDIDNSAGLGVGKDRHYTETNEGKLIDAKGVKGRYVRLYSKGNTSNDLNHYIEVAVFGKPAE